jgi:hypothetical protein
VLPCFMAAGDPQLVPLLPEENIQCSYWISSRRELHKSVRLRVLWDYVVELCARAATVARRVHLKKPDQNVVLLELSQSRKTNSALPSRSPFTSTCTECLPG